MLTVEIDTFRIFLPVPRAAYERTLDSFLSGLFPVKHFYDELQMPEIKKGNSLSFIRAQFINLLPCLILNNAVL